MKITKLYEGRAAVVSYSWLQIVVISKVIFEQEALNTMWSISE